MIRRHGPLIGAVTLWLAACTYGPEEEQVRIEQIVPLGDSYRALITVRHDRLRAPTGLSAFPDGGRALILRRRALQYLVDGRERRVRLFMEREAPEELWESFHLRVAGVDGDSVVYVTMTGCPRGGECWGELQRTSHLRATLDGSLRPVDGIPDGVGLPGTMLARRQGELNFIRWSTERDTVTARLVEGGPFVPAFVVSEDGVLAALRR